MFFRNYWASKLNFASCVKGVTEEKMSKNKTLVFL